MYPVTHLMCGHGACGREGTGQGTLLVLCDPGAVLSLSGPRYPHEKERGDGKEDNGVQPRYPPLPVPLLRAGVFLAFCPSSPTQPPRHGHTLPRACCREARRPLRAQGAEQINKCGILVQTSPGPGSPEPLAGLPGRVGERLGLCPGFQKQRTLGVAFLGRAWWVTGEPLEESCLFRKHTQWDRQGEPGWPGGALGPTQCGWPARPQTRRSHSLPLQTHPTTSGTHLWEWGHGLPAPGPGKKDPVSEMTRRTGWAPAPAAPLRRPAHPTRPPLCSHSGPWTLGNTIWCPVLGTLSGEGDQPQAPLLESAWTPGLTSPRPEARTEAPFLQLELGTTSGARPA